MKIFFTKPSIGKLIFLIFFDMLYIIQKYIKIEFDSSFYISYYIFSHKL